MTSEARSEAARRNGAKSNGPKTPEGKAISSANSLRHGMTAKAILLTNENPEAYTKLAAAYYEKFQPADDVERDLVDEMVIAKWRQRRDWSNEAALFDLEMDRQTKRSTPNTRKSTTPAATPWPSGPWLMNRKPSSSSLATKRPIAGRTIKRCPRSSNSAPN